MSMRLWDLVGIELTFIWQLSDERVQVTRLYLKAAVARCNILQWRHNERDGVSNRRHLECLLSRLFRRISKKTIKAPRQWPLWGEFTGNRWIPHTKGQWRGKCFHLMTPSCVGVGAVWTNYAVLRQERITRWRMPDYLTCGFPSQGPVMQKWFHVMTTLCSPKAGIILCMRSANERRRYIIMSSLIGRVHGVSGWYYA